MHRAAVVTVSDRSAMGLRRDETGPVIVGALREAGFDVGDATIVPDDVLPIRDAVRRAHDGGARLIITTGGTGIGPRDRTPEAVRTLLDLELPNIPHAISMLTDAPATALLSRGVAGVIGGDTAAYRSMINPPTLVVTLPGSPGGVRDGLTVILSIAHHAIAQLDGGDHEGAHDHGAHDHTAHHHATHQAGDHA